MIDKDTLKLAKFHVEIKCGDINIDQEGLSYSAALGLCEGIVRDNLDVEEIQEAWKRVGGSSFGFCGTSQGDFEFSVSARRESKEIPNSEQTCPRRMNEFGPWKYEEKLDHWIMQGDDPCCSFCGSMKPERVIELIKEHGCGIVGGTTKSYKRYINRKNVPNAGFGGIKFYTQHFSREEIDEINMLFKPL